MGAVGSQNQMIPVEDEVLNPNQWDEPYFEPFKTARKYKGTIYSGDLNDPRLKKYGLPTGEVQMVRIGEWATGEGTWAFADGSHANMWFRRERNGIYYLENINS